MAEPVSIAASAAGFVGLVDVALRASKEVYTFFSALGDATREIKLLSAELKDISDILAEVHAFTSDYALSSFAANGGPKLESLLNTLRKMQDEVSNLSKAVKPMEPNASRTKVKTMANHFQWVFLKNKLDGYH